MEKFGYHGQVLHIDLNSRSFKAEAMDARWYRAYAGGALMGGYFILRGAKSGAQALGGENPLVFAASVPAGYDAPALAQFSAVALSPLSDGIVSAQCEGEFGRFLKASSYDAVIFHGRAKNPVSLFIEDGVPRLVEAGWVWGSSALECASLMARDYGTRTDAIVSIGQAGENLVSFASVVSGAGNQAAPGGVGAVMGGKNLKSFMLGGGSRPKAHDPERLLELNASFSGAALGRALFSPPPAAQSADGSHSVLERILDQYRSESPCPSCPFGCVHHIGAKDAPLVATSVNRWRAKSLARDPDPDIWLRANALCNDYGYDPAALRQALFFAAECAEAGIVDSGVEGFSLREYATVLPLIELITERRGIGDILARGVMRAAELLGEDAVLIAQRLKREDSYPADMREDTAFACAALSLCPYASKPDGLAPEHVRELLLAITGWDVKPSEFVRWNRRLRLIHSVCALRDPI